MENGLPYGSDSGSSTFGKIKERLSGIPTYLLAFLAVLVTTLILGGFYLFLSPNISLKDLVNKVKKPEEEINEEKNITEPFKPSPRPLATGKQTYLISGSTKGAPKMSEVTFDPIDPKSDQNQTIIIKALDVNGSFVKTVTVTLNTDNKGEIHSLSLTQGTAQDGVWQGSWKISDSYDYKYTATIRAENAAGLAQTATLTLR